MVVEEAFTVAAGRERVWAFLLDVPRAAACMPGLEAVTQTGDATYDARMKVKVGPLGAAFTLTVTIVEQTAPELVRASVRGKDKGGSLVQAEVTTTLRPEGDGTAVAYRMDVHLRGPLAKFGQTVVRDTAKKLSARFAACLRDGITAGVPSGAAGE